MHREINHLSAKFPFYFPLKGNLSVFDINYSGAEMAPVLPNQVPFANGVWGSFILGI